MHKVTLRRQFLTERKTLTTGEVKRRSELIARHFFDFLTTNNLTDVPAIIHTFLPIQWQNEVDTWSIIHFLWSNYAHLNVAVPVIDDSDHTLRHYRLFPQTQLVENRWGIPEPITTDFQSLQPPDFDIVLVPLLAFDQHGQRVGYGGGFYDRFLAECRPNCQKVGLSLFIPIERIDDIELTDIPLDACITPERVYRFK